MIQQSHRLCNLLHTHLHREGQQPASHHPSAWQERHQIAGGARQREGESSTSHSRLWGSAQWNAHWHSCWFLYQLATVSEHSKHSWWPEMNSVSNSMDSYNPVAVCMWFMWWPLLPWGGVWWVSCIIIIVMSWHCDSAAYSMYTHYNKHTLYMVL